MSFLISKVIESNPYLKSSGGNVWKIGSLVKWDKEAGIFNVTSKMVPGGPYVAKIGATMNLLTEYQIFSIHLTSSKISETEELFGHRIYLPNTVDHGTFGNEFCFIVTSKMTPNDIVVPMQNSQFIKLLRDILYSLKYIHFLRFFYGNIRSNTIFLMNGHYYLTDFAVSWMVNSESEKLVDRDKTFVGTLAYMGRDMHITGNGPSFRTDLDNLILCSLEWAGVNLPWKDNQFISPKNIRDQKLEFFTNPDRMLRNVNSSIKREIISAFIRHANELNITENLNYDLLLRILEKHNKPCDSCSTFGGLKRFLSTSTDLKDRAVVQALQYLNLWDVSETACDFCARLDDLKKWLPRSENRRDKAAVRALKHLGLSL